MKYFLYILLPITILFGSCGYLDMVPEDDIETIETIFEKRENADEWLKTCYSFLRAPIASIRTNPAIVGADEFVGGDYIRSMSVGTVSEFSGFKIADGLQMSQSPYGSIWSNTSFYAAIRYCNIFLEKIDGVYNMTNDEKRQWVAEIKALKAMYYFELVRRYGPIILRPQNVELTEPLESMKGPRSPVDECIEAIVELLDEAMEDLLPIDQKEFSRKTYLCLEAAAGLKAKALLYAASPLFNGNSAYSNFKNKAGVNLFSTNYDHEKWKRAAEAADEAIRICEVNGKKLVQGIENKSTTLLSTMYDIERSVLAPGYMENTEILNMVKVYGSGAEYDRYFVWTLPYIVNGNTALSGCIGPSIKMVETYYTNNGLPIDQDREWDYAGRYKMGKEASAQYENVVSTSEPVLNLHLRREPRFYACVAADRCYWQMGASSVSPMLVTAYKGESFGLQGEMISSSISQNLSGYWLKKMSHSTIQLNTYQNNLVNGPFPAMRMAELYLMQAEAWNEYEGPSEEKVYAPLNKIRERAGIPDVVTSWKSYSKDPGRVDSREGMRQIIRDEYNVELAFEGHRFWNLRRWKIAHEELNEKRYGWNVLGENARTFYNDYEGPMIVWRKGEFVSPRDYLFPIRAEEVLVSGCVQNPGW